MDGLDILSGILDDSTMPLAFSADRCNEGMAARTMDASYPHAARMRQPEAASKERQCWKGREGERRQQSRNGCWQASKRVMLPVPPESPNSKPPLSRRKEIELMSAVLAEDSLNASQAVREMQTRDRVSLLAICAAQQQTPGASTPRSQLNLQTELHRTQEVLAGLSIENGALTIEISKCAAVIHDLQVQLQLERR